MPRENIRVLSIYIDPGTADATLAMGNESAVINFTGGPGPLPLAEALHVCGELWTIANANGDAVVTVIYESLARNRT